MGRHYARIRALIGHNDDDTIGAMAASGGQLPLSAGEELLLALQEDNSFENFLLVHDEFVQMLVAEANRDDISEELQAELVVFVAAFHSMRQVILSFIAGDGVLLSGVGTVQ